MSLQGRFLGAAEDIGRLGFVLGAGDDQYLFDYGLAPDKPPDFPLEAPPVDHAFLTHAHLDHSGMVPWLAGRHDGLITTTPVTAAISRMMHEDSLKIARIEGYPIPFDHGDVDDVERIYDTRGFHEPVDVGGHEATLHSAGHIPGAAQVHVEGDSADFVFTGDFYTDAQRLVGAAENVPCDVLAMETTYAGREHPPRDQVEEDFLAFVEDRTDRGGMVVAAAFAIGRAQELAMVLHEQGYDVWMDGMARRVSTTFRRYPDFLADPKAFDQALWDVKFVRGQRGRGVALDEADVIITTSGMVEGGPIMHYLDRLHDDPNSGIALTGYQVRGTNGRRLWDTGEVDVDINGPGEKVVKVQGEVRHFDFSAHAGHDDMVEFARRSGASDIVLFHGDNREALEPDLSDFADVHMPNRGEHFTID